MVVSRPAIIGIEGRQVASQGIAVQPAPDQATGPVPVGTEEDHHHAQREHQVHDDVIRGVPFPMDQPGDGIDDVQIAGNQQRTPVQHQGHQEEGDKERDHQVLAADGLYPGRIILHQ